MSFTFFPVAEKYKVRHAILGHLYGKLSDSPLHKTNLNLSKTLVTDLAGVLNITPEELKKWHMSFHAFEDDRVECFNDHEVYEIGITEAGIIAYLDDYWLREGEKAIHDRIYNKTRWILPLAALLIAFAAFFISISKSCNK